MKPLISQNNDINLFPSNQVIASSAYSFQNAQDQADSSNQSYSQSFYCLPRLSLCDVSRSPSKPRSKLEHGAQEIVCSNELWNEFIQELRGSKVVTTMATKQMLANFVNKKMAGNKKQILFGLKAQV